MNTLKWTSREEALNGIAGGTRLLLTFFYSPECVGSKNILEETLQDEQVIKVIEREYAPVMCNIVEDEEAARKAHVSWTPSFIVSDEGGNELERWLGYLPPVEFTAQLLLSKGIASFHLKMYDKAIAVLERLVQEHPESEFVPEAEFLIGAANFKKTGEADTMIDVCHTLNSTHPESQWAKKCSIWTHMDSRGPFVGYDGGGSAGSGAY